jgi:radical SAM superfamily enzyme YgiQ (UPF0313 family)
MKILLVEPSKPPLTIGGDDIYMLEPLALEYVAAGVVGDHEVRILDTRLDTDLDGTLSRFAPDVVGITSYTVHVNVVKGLFRQIREWNPDVLTVVGGHHATVSPMDFHTPDIDIIVMGEGVEAFKEISSRREKGQGLSGIPGTAIADGEELVKTAATELVDLDALPFPARTLTAGYRSEYYSQWMKPLASIRTSKGCPFRCNFCALWKLTSGRYLCRQPELIVEELQGIEEEFVFLADDESLVNARRMKRLGELIKAAGIKKRFFLYARSDTIARNHDLLEAWRDIGLERVFVGLEFFREEDLDFINKGSSVSDNERAIKILQDLGIDIYPSFIVRPEFTRADFEAFTQYCRGLGLGFIAFSVLTPLPGTDFYEEVKDRMLTHEFEFFDFVHTVLPTALPLEEFYAEYRQLYTKSPSFWKQLSYFWRYRLTELPSALFKGVRMLNRFKTLHRDYDRS